MSRRLALAAAALPPASLAPAADAAPSRVVDRTWVCSPVAAQGFRTIELAGAPASEQTPARISIASGGTQSPVPLVTIENKRLLGRPTGAIYVNARRCKRVARRPALTSKGLITPPDRFLTESDCDAPPKVVVRVRAILEKAASWRPAGQGVAIVRADVREASFVVRKVPDAPFAFAAIDQAGGIRVFENDRCF
jgi:hypothetical protein